MWLVPTLNNVKIPIFTVAKSPYDESMALLVEARKLLDTNPNVSLDTADTSLEKFLKAKSRKKGANQNSKVPHGNQEIEFGRWVIPDYITWLDGKNAITKHVKESFYKVHELRNQVHHGNLKCSRLLAERAIVVIEYAIGAEINPRRGRKPKPKPLPYKIPSKGERHVQVADLKLWEKRGWKEATRHGSTVVIRKKYNKAERLEMKARYLLSLLGFEGVPDLEDFWNKDLGQQIDACGGTDGVFLVIDCTTKQETGQKSIANKIDDTLKKRSKISKRIDDTYGSRFHTKIFAICSEGILVSRHDREVAEKAGIRLIDSEDLADWTWYYRELGISLKYHIVRALAGFSPVIVDRVGDPMFRFGAFRINSEGQLFYHFLANPETLLELAYVYRLDYTNPFGYQRELNESKIRRINDFLSDQGNFFANNLVLSLDSLGGGELWPDFKVKQDEVV